MRMDIAIGSDDLDRLERIEAAASALLSDYQRRYPPVRRHLFEDLEAALTDDLIAEAGYDLSAIEETQRDAAAREHLRGGSWVEWAVGFAGLLAAIIGIAVYFTAS